MLVPLRLSLSIVTLLFVAFVTASAVVLSLYFFSTTVDDAFIVYRYSENLIDRGELVFNPGERVNALTSPLHGLLLAIVYAAYGNTEVGNKILSIVLLALVLSIPYRHLFAAGHRWAYLVFASLVALLRSATSGRPAGWRLHI